MQSLAFLWFQLQMTKQYLREKTFGPALSPANSANLDKPIGAGTPLRKSIKQVPTIVSAMERRVSDSPSQNFFGWLALGPATPTTSAKTVRPRNRTPFVSG